MLLAIETSSLVSSVALLHDDTLRAELTIQARLTHSEQLMPHIADMLDKASVKKSQIDGVAVAVGPGSFTGLRIGLATAKGLSFAWNVPIVGVTTPVSLAWNFVGVSDRICTLIDAQKGNVYAGVYRGAAVVLRLPVGNKLHLTGRQAHRQRQKQRQRDPSPLHGFKPRDPERPGCGCR
ncbi:tRNA (adenosine(37)-N6)-threonylcarbamoyltransferase complex dimerization subunit type 1 TsaB [Megasphaera sp.]|uniref:tRNA (adenosine(37)-N6)-threonylcarbamoyltransferase complex dimerization subunit type 1 TsaB n=1 Tax=Megasphaera sp. TaxID=2023260 RepID=UPI003076940C